MPPRPVTGSLSSSSSPAAAAAAAAAAPDASAAAGAPQPPPVSPAANNGPRPSGAGNAAAVTPAGTAAGSVIAGNGGSLSIPAAADTPIRGFVPAPVPTGHVVASFGNGPSLGAASGAGHLSLAGPGGSALRLASGSGAAGSGGFPLNRALSTSSCTPRHFTAVLSLNTQSPSPSLPPKAAQRNVLHLPPAFAFAEKLDSPVQISVGDLGSLLLIAGFADPHIARTAADCITLLPARSRRCAVLAGIVNTLISLLTRHWDLLHVRISVSACICALANSVVEISRLQKSGGSACAGPAPALSCSPTLSTAAVGNAQPVSGTSGASSNAAQVPGGSAAQGAQGSSITPANINSIAGASMIFGLAGTTAGAASASAAAAPTATTLAPAAASHTTTASTGGNSAAITAGSSLVVGSNAAASAAGAAISGGALAGSCAMLFSGHIQQPAATSPSNDSNCAFPSSASSLPPEPTIADLRPAEIVPLLLRLVKESQDSVLVVDESLCALALLSSDYSIKHTIRCSGGCKTVHAALSSADPDVRLAALRLTRCLSADFLCRVDLRNEGVLTLLLDLCSSEFPEIQELALECIACFASADSAALVDLRRLTATRKVAEILIAQNTAPGALPSALLAFATLIEDASAQLASMAITSSSPFNSTSPNTTAAFAAAPATLPAASAPLSHLQQNAIANANPATSAASHGSSGSSFLSVSTPNTNNLLRILDFVNKLMAREDTRLRKSIAVFFQAYAGSPRRQSELRESGCIATIAAALTNSNLGVANAFAKAIRSVALHEGNEVELLRLGVIDVLVQRSNEPDFRESALSAAATCFDHQKLRARLKSIPSAPAFYADLIRDLSVFISFTADCKTSIHQQASTLPQTAATANNPNFTVSAAAATTVGISPEDDLFGLIISAAACILALAKDENLRAEFVRIGALQAVIAALQAAAQSAASPAPEHSCFSAISVTARALSRLLAESDARSLFRLHGGPDTVVSLLRLQCPRITADACWLISAACLFAPSVAIDFCQVGAIDYLVAAANTVVTGAGAPFSAPCSQDEVTCVPREALDRLLTAQLSAHYWLRNYVAPDQLLTDVFYDAGPRRGFVQTQGQGSPLRVNFLAPIPFPSLSSLRESALDPSTDVVLVGSPTEDPEIARLVHAFSQAIATTLPPLLPAGSVTAGTALAGTLSSATASDAVQQVLIAARMVLSHMHGAAEDCRANLAALKLAAQCNVVPLGLVTCGSMALRAILLKVICDRGGCAAQIGLHRGDYGLVWNTAVISSRLPNYSSPQPSVSPKSIGAAPTSYSGLNCTKTAGDGALGGANVWGGTSSATDSLRAPGLQTYNTSATNGFDGKRVVYIVDLMGPHAPMLLPEGSAAAISYVSINSQASPSKRQHLLKKQVSYVD